MRLYAVCSDEQVHFCEMSASTSLEYIGSFYHHETDQFVDFLIWMVRLGWSGSIMCSSSMDWSEEEGWPEEVANDWVERGINEMERRAEILIAEREQMCEGAAD